MKMCEKSVIKPKICCGTVKDSSLSWKNHQHFYEENNALTKFTLMTRNNVLTATSAETSYYLQ